MKLKKVATLFAGLTFAGILGAVTAVPYPIQIVQPDGTSIEVTLKGDEHFHYYLTSDGVPAIMKSGSLCYAFQKDSLLLAGPLLAHEIEHRSKLEQDWIADNPIDLTSIMKKVEQKRVVANQRRIKRLRRGALGKFGNYKGKRKGLVILVEFQNLKMAYASAHQDFNRMFNESGYSDNGAIGSVSDFFREQSYGLFELDFDVVGPVTVERNYEYYGRPDPITGENDSRPRNMVVEACKLVDDQINFADYDWDGDGEAEQVFIIYAGYGESSGGSENTIWPHQWVLGNKYLRLDGVIINTYACSNELAGISGSQYNGIGTACHEFSHCLGYPDIYDTDYSGGFAMSYWDIMSSGSHNGPENNGEIPRGYTAFERYMAGWLTFKEITESGHYEGLGNIEDSPEAYVIQNQGNPDEVFILENHQPTRWDSYVKSTPAPGGLMIVHVDYDKAAWANNDVNQNPDHQRYNIIPADQEYGENLTGDLFNSNTATRLTDSSHSDCGGKLFTVNSDGTLQMGKNIVNIAEIDGKISFDILQTKDIQIPTPKEAIDIDEDGFTARWEPVVGAEGYLVEQECKKMTPFGEIPVTKSVSSFIMPRVRMEWIDAERPTSYRVCAIVNGVRSNWSSSISVSLNSGVDMISEGENSDEYFGVDGVRRMECRRGVNIVRRGNSFKKVYTK